MLIFAMLSLSSWDSLGDPALCPFMQRKLQAGEPAHDSPAICGAVSRSSLTASPPDPGQTTYQGCNCSTSCAPRPLKPVALKTGLGCLRVAPQNCGRRDHMALHARN